MKDPIYESVFAIKEELARMSESLLGGVDSWDKYNQLVGKARGLKEALDIINDVLQEDEEKDVN
jgi:hypothetical protein